MKGSNEEILEGNGRLYWVGKKMHHAPSGEEVTIERIFHSESSGWDDPDVPEIGNVMVKYQDGAIGKCNNWQLRDLGDPKNHESKTRTNTK